MSIVGRLYKLGDEVVDVRIQWGLKSRGETYGGPRNVLVQREDGRLEVRPFRGLRALRTWARGNRVPMYSPWAEESAKLNVLCCAMCGQSPDGDDLFGGHDPCIADLPGVRFACCGHGVQSEDHCYLALDDGIVLHGHAAHACMEMLGGSPPRLPLARRKMDAIRVPERRGRVSRS